MARLDKKIANWRGMPYNEANKKPMKEWRMMAAYRDQAVAAMQKNGFEVVQVATAAQAREYLLSHIADGCQVGVGGSMSIREIGVMPELEKKGCTLHAHWGLPPEEGNAAIHQAHAADVYLCSTNAITRSGKLVLVDGRGNRLAAICDGPADVFIVTSEDKIVDGGIDAAIARTKKDATPPNCRRLNLNTQCVQDGKCAGSDCQNSICRLTLVVDRVPNQRRMTVVLVEEKLGY